MDGKDLTQEEKRMYKKKVLMLPQQIKDGFNEAMLVYVLIFAHRNILVLDNEVREIFNLTDENILSFDIMKEYEKAGGKEYQRLIDIGERKSMEI